MTTKSIGINRDTLVFHGTTGNFDNFDINYLRQPSTPSDEAKAIFFTTEYDTALAHAKRKALLTRAEPTVIEAYIKYKNLYDATAAIRVNRHKFKTYSQTKRYIYNKIDVNKYDAVEIRGDDVNTPEIAVFDPSVIKIVKNNIIEASDKKTTVIKNPTAAQIKRLIKNEPYHEIKGWVEGRDVYFWNNVENWHHADQAASLGTPYNQIHTRANNLNKLVIMPIAEGGYNKDSGKYALVHYGWNDDADKLKGIKVFLNSPYLRGIIKDLDLYIDDPHGERLGNDDHDLVNYIKGTDYMKMLMIASDFNELLCWIDDNGREIDVTGTDQSHAGAFRRLYNEDPALKSRFDTVFARIDQNSVYSFATRDLGWIRVSGHGRHCSIMITKNRVSSRAVSALARVLKDYEYGEFIVEYFEPYNDDNNKVLYKLSEVIADLRNNVGKELVASYSGTGEYGYWLHDGKIGEVEHQAHDMYVRKHFSNKKLGAEPWAHGFKQGWIRAVNERTGNLSIELWYGFVDREALKALSELINKRNTYKGFIVEISRGTSNDVLPEHLRKRWFTFKEGEEKQVLHLVRQCLKDSDMTAMDEQYGYWFTNKGEQLDVEEMAHNKVADNYLDLHSDLEDRYVKYRSEDTSRDVKDFALKELGWIRCTVTDDRLDIEIAPGKVSSKAFKALRKYIDKESIAEEFLLDVINMNSRFLNRDRKQALYNDIQKQVDKTMTASDDYGYWITDKGDLLKVDFEDHNGAADQYIHRHYYKEYLAWVQETDIMAPSWFALTKGFIRLVAEGNAGNALSVEIDSSGITREAYRTLSKFFTDHYFDRVYLDISKKRLTDESKQFAEAKDNLNKFLPFIRTFIRKNNMTAYDDSEETFEAWVTDKEVVPSPMSHLRTLKKILASKKMYTNLKLQNIPDGFGSNSEAYTYGAKQGWIRVAGRPATPSIMFCANTVSMGAYKNVYKYFTDRVAKDTQIFIDIIHEKETLFKELHLAKALQLVRQNVSNNMEAASDFYGAWITDKGEVLEVDREDHAAAFMIYKSHSKELSEQFAAQYHNHKTNDIYAFALGLGWLRVVSGSKAFRVEFKKESINRRAFSSLVKYIKDYGEFDMFIFDIMAADGTANKGGEFYDLSRLLTLLRKNIRKDKTIVAIDGDNNVTGRYSQIAIERWQPDNSADQIQLLNIGQDFVIRSITGSDSYDLEPFRFIETARRALLDMVRDMEKAGVIYKKQAVQPIEIYSNSLEAADEETVIKRWETGSGKHAITLVKDQYGYSINNFIRVPSGEYKKDGTSYLGKADLEQALKKINEQLNLYKTVDGTGFREVRVSKVLENLVPKKEAQKTAQVTVRGKVQDHLDDFTKFSKQPETPGLTVYVKKTGSFQYAKIVHTPSKLVLIDLTKKPLSFSPSELVERIDLSPFKNYNWTLPQDQLFKKYGPNVLASATMNFTRSLDMKKMDKTDQALESGLKNWVKDYIIALYLKRPAAAKNLAKQIDADIKKGGLSKEKVYFYYGNPSIKSEEVWAKVGLIRTGTSSPYKYEFADKVPQSQPAPVKPTTSLSPVGQAIALIQQGSSLDAAVRQVAKNKGELDSLRRDVKLEIQRSSRIKQETGDKLIQKQGDYTWATIAGRARKSEFSFNYKSSTIGSILVPDGNLVKTLQSFGNNKVDPEYFDSPYLKKLHLDRSPNYGINLSYDLYSGTKKVGIIYSPTPEIFNIIKRINTVADTPLVKAEKPAIPKSGMVGNYVTGTTKSGDKIAGILLTEKRNPKTYKSEGTAVVIDKSGAARKVNLTGVRRKLVKPPANLAKAYKTMTASLRLEAHSKIKRRQYG